MAHLDRLWEPLKVGAMRLHNRVAVAAHGTGFRYQQYADYLRERARGGAALVVTGAQAVHPSGEISRAPRGWDREVVTELKLAANAVHEHDTRLIVQIFHIGAQDPGNSRLDYWGLVQGPSADPSPAYGVIPHVMQADEIESLIEGFVRTAVHSQEAGADGVEIHGAHGYLLHAFLSPLMNHRTDEWGGSVQNRARIVLEIARRIRERCGAALVVGAKLTADEFAGPQGITYAETEATIRVLHASGLFDYFGLSAGNYGGFHRLVVPAIAEISGHTAEFGAIARRAVNFEVPVMVTGTIRTIERAAEIIAAGQADIVGMLRAHIADPDIVVKAKAGRIEEIRRCIGANQGCWRRLARDGIISCTVNPITGREAEWGTAANIAAPDRRRVLVIGGGPAGMKLAETAARRGHEVTLVEREEELGGQVRFARRLPHRHSWGHLIEDLTRSLTRLNVDVRVSTEMTAAGARGFGADAIVVATGSTWETTGRSVHVPATDRVVRADGAHVIDPISAISDPESCGRNVVIADDNGTYLPLGLAEQLASTGRDVTIVTPLAGVGSKLGAELTAELGWAYPRIVRAGVKVRPYSYVQRIEAGTAVIGSVWGEEPETMAADTVITVLLCKANDGLFLELYAQDQDVQRIGDCLAPRELDHALFEGARVGHAL